MGDLHCASTHLKSQLHASKYNVSVLFISVISSFWLFRDNVSCHLLHFQAFLEKNPHFEVNWLADRQRVLNERKLLPPPQQITSVSTTAAESTLSKKSKKEEKVKKRKKKAWVLDWLRHTIYIYPNFYILVMTWVVSGRIFCRLFCYFSTSYRYSILII